MIGGIIKLLLTAVNGTVQQDNFLQIGDGSIAPLFAFMPFPIQAVHAGTCNSSAGVVSGAPIVPYDPTRKVLKIYGRTNGAEVIDLGVDTTITVGAGIPIYPGGSETFTGAGATGPYWAICGVASSPFTWAEG